MPSLDRFWTSYCDKNLAGISVVALHKLDILEKFHVTARFFAFFKKFRAKPRTSSPGKYIWLSTIHVWVDVPISLIPNASLTHPQDDSELPSSKLELRT